MVVTDHNTGSSSPSPAEPDDISLFVRELLHRSSCTSSSPTPLILPSSFPPLRSHAPDQLPVPCFFSPLPTNTTQQISHEALTGVVFSPSSYFPASGGSNLSSESLTGSVQMRSFENDPEECDCQSEEGPEAVLEEAETKPPQPRNQSKRSRAAEVHNLSEKRRRSRINEKMKALQNLIPNSNKTDKASMLDEAIEYLKQLQLQVQILSMRNGLSLHPMCLPGVAGILQPSQLSDMGLDFTNKGRSPDVHITNSLNTTLDTSHAMINLPNQQCATSGRPSFHNVSSVINSEDDSFALESCIPAFNLGPLHRHTSSQPQAICKEENVHRERLLMNHIETKSLVTTMPLPFDTRESNPEAQNHVEAHLQRSYGHQEMLHDSVSGQNQLIASNFSGYGGTISAQNEQLTVRR